MVKGLTTLITLKTVKDLARKKPTNVSTIAEKYGNCLTEHNEPYEDELCIVISFINNII